MSSASPRFLWSLAVLLACGPTAPEATTDSATGDTTDTTAATASTSGAATDTNPPTTSDATTSTTQASSTSTTSATTGVTTATTTTEGSTTADATTDPGSTTGDMTGASTGDPVACSPPDAPVVEVFWEVRFLDVDAPDSFKGDCNFTSQTPSQGGVVIALACVVGGKPSKVEVEVVRAPAQDFPQFGGVVTLNFRKEMPWWTNSWFALRPKGGSATLSGIQADKVVPPGTTAQEFFGYEVALHQGLCDPMPWDCGTLERAALDIDPFGFQAVPVFDGQYREIVNLPGAVLAWVDEMVLLEVANCTDTPSQWTSAVMQSWFGP